MGTKTQKLSNVVDQIVEWQSVVVADGSTNTTGVSGRGYFIDTSAGTHTINLPASPKIGDVIKVSVITAGNQLTIGRNGNNINGATSDLTTSADGDMFELVYVNTSEGWKTVGQISAGTFISATGGTVTESGDFKIHTFTGDGCFVVSSLGNGDSNPLGGPSTVDYLVIAGGGGGGGGQGTGGGGAGGYRESSGAASGCYTASPLGACVSALPVSAQTYPITVGGGGAATPGGSENGAGTPGVNSVFSTITSTGGGGGGAGGGAPGGSEGSNGGSGGGGGGRCGSAAGSGNTPPVSPAQGQNGGPATPSGASPTVDSGGGGGGATAAGTAGTASCTGGAGGAGATSSINATPTTRAGGGGGGSETGGGGSGGSGGGGDGGGGPLCNGQNATGNTGSGGGGKGIDCRNAGNGGKGIVVIRYKFQN